MAALAEFDQHPDFTLNVAKDMIKCAKAIKQTKEYDNEDLLLCLVFLNTIYALLDWRLS